MQTLTSSTHFVAKMIGCGVGWTRIYVLYVENLCLFIFSHTHGHTLSRARHETKFASSVCERERCSSIKPVSKWAMAPGAHTAALGPPGLKLEQLTGADGPARSQAPLGPVWRYHYHINHGCTHMDHSLTTETTWLCVCVSERERERERESILTTVPFLLHYTAIHFPSRDNECSSE